MQINKIAPKVVSTLKKSASKARSSVSAGVTRIGENIEKGGKWHGINKFVQGEGINPGRGAFLVLITTCTLIPRLLKARDDDEKREILTRDIATILTICFAMKGLEAGFSKLASKKSGLNLVQDSLPKNANPLRKFFGYFKEQNGVSALSGDEISALYTGMADKNVFVNTLKYIKDKNGDLGKVLTIDRKSNKPSVIERFVSKITKKPQKQQGDLTSAVLDLFKTDKVDDILNMGNEKIFNHITNVDENNEALKNILELFKNEKTSPFAKFANNIGAIFKTISLGIVVSFLGFGLPKINEKMTRDKYFSKDGQGLKAQFENPTTPLGKSSFKVLNSFDNEEKKIYQNFLGKIKN